VIILVYITLGLAKLLRRQKARPDTVYHRKARPDTVYHRLPLVNVIRLWLFFFQVTIFLVQIFLFKCIVNF